MTIRQTNKDRKIKIKSAAQHIFSTDPAQQYPDPAQQDPDPMKKYRILIPAFFQYKKTTFKAKDVPKNVSNSVYYYTLCAKQYS